MTVAMKTSLFSCVIFAVLLCETSFAQSGLVLKAGWEKTFGVSGAASVEFSQLLRSFVKPQVDLTGEPGLEIFNGITYLMSLDEARMKIGGGRPASINSSARSIATGYPTASISLYEFRGRFADGFPHLILLTDMNKQVVAAQLLDRTPKAVFLTGHSNDISYYDFVSQKRKAVPAYRVANQSKMTGRIFQLDSELLDAVLKPRERSRLLVPDKFASIMLALLQGTAAP